MRLHLKKIRFKNFLSVGDEFIEIVFDRYKTLLIVGKNGTGKSTLLDALSFVLFNKPFRKINKPQLVNSINGKECLVECEFTINGYNFLVRRGIKPVVFEIYKDGELITQAADNRDYQEAFEKHILKINHRTFCQIEVLGSAIFTPFMALPALQRRDVIEDLLDLEIFTKMNVLLKSKLDDLERQCFDSESDKRLVEERIKMTEDYHNQISQSKELLIENERKKIADLTNKVSAINQQLEEVGRELTLLHNVSNDSTLEKEKTEIVILQSQLRQRHQQIGQELLFFQNNMTCPTCHQHIDDSFRSNTIQKHEKTSKEITSALKKLDVKFKKIETQIKDLLEFQTRSAKLVNEIRFKNIERNQLASQIKDVEQEIERFQTQTFEFDFAKLEAMKVELSEIEKLLIEMKDNKTVMSYAAMLLKDSGIKGKIIKTFIPVINQLIQKYLAAMDFFVDFQLDEQFKETILSRNRDNFSYESFSEGEKMRLNLAILFTWRAISKMRASVDINVLVFDELLDSALDSEGIDNIVKVIGNLTQNDNVIIISHREDQISDKFEKVIRFEKIKNFSQVR